MHSIPPKPPGTPWTELDSVAYQARARPGKRAAVDLRTGESLTYAELDLLVARFAGFLRGVLAEPMGARVATLLRNGLDGLALMYACERVGAIFTPLNWRLTPVEIAALIADAEPGLLVYEDEFAAAAETAGAPTVRTGPGPDELRGRVEACEPVAARPGPPDATCVMLYTSGTTGRPKGVMLSRANMFWGVFNFAEVGEVGPHSAMLCDTPMFHTVGLVATCRCTLYRGGTLYLSDRFIPAVTLQRLSDPALGVTHFFGVPQIAQMLKDDPAWASADLTRLTGLFLGGAPLPHALCLDLLDAGIPLSNGYGMTETSTVVHMPLDAAATRAKPVSTGYAAPTMQIRIVDQEGGDQPVGQPGEVWLRGPSVTSGYWRQPEATAAAFHDGWLKTGDAGYLDEAGFLFLIDRWKDMYISGGENVYPAEVENAISLLEGVREVGVVGIADARWGEVGCAFVVLHAAGSVDEDAVRAHCRERLARYKQPAHVRFVELLPRTASGKLRKDELRRWFTA